MSEPKSVSSSLYRLFQKLACGVGVILTIVGFAMQQQLLWVIGLVILLHGVIATVLIAYEDRRSAK